MEIVPSVNAGATSGTTKADQSAAKLAEDFDTFLTLLTTQLQNQDPLEPMDSKEFTQQLVSFTGVEQQISANQNLEKLIEQISAQDMSASVAYIGKEVVALSNKARLADGEATWGYYLDGRADATEITIKDNRGVTVHKLPGETDPGDHQLVWDGMDAQGRELPDGYYTIEITALTAGGNALNTQTYVRGLVDGFERVNGENLLTINGLLMPIENVQAVGLPEAPPSDE